MNQISKELMLEFITESLNNHNKMIENTNVSQELLHTTLGKIQTLEGIIRMINADAFQVVE